MFRNMVFFGATLVLTSGCLVDNLETLTAETKAAVIQTDADQHLGAYVALYDGGKNPSIRQANALNVMWNFPFDQLFVFFGAPNPFTGQDRFMYDPNTPNVSFVGNMDSDPLKRVGGITPKAWADCAAACNMALSKLLRDETSSNTSSADRDAIPDRTWRTVWVCTAVAGAFPQHWDDPELSQKAWPRDDKAMKYYNQVKHDIEQLIIPVVKKAKLPSYQEVEIETLIAIKLHNIYNGVRATP